MLLEAKVAGLAAMHEFTCTPTQNTRSGFRPEPYGPLPHPHN